MKIVTAKTGRWNMFQLGLNAPNTTYHDNELDTASLGYPDYFVEYSGNKRYYAFSSSK